MSRQRKRHPDTVNAGKMYTAQRKTSFKVGYYSDRKRWRAVSRLIGWPPKRLYWWGFMNWVGYQHPEAYSLEVKYLRGRK